MVRRPNELIAIEVKSGEMKRPKISRSLRSFIEAYRPDRTFILNRSGQDTMTINGSEVIIDRHIAIPGIFREER